MCEFFSAVSDGKGKTLFFKIEDVAKVMSEGNPKELDFNSHTSLMSFAGIKRSKEDAWNKWEYNVDKKELKEDSIVTTNDAKKVKSAIERYLKDKDLGFMRNLYGGNSGDRNSGYLNSGYLNSGDRNSGYRNSGDLNSGNLNSGNRNSGNRNSGNWNSGNWNSGYLNSDEPTVRMFNKDTGLKVSEINIPSWMWDLELTKWVSFDDMTEEEKVERPKAYICDGYLKTTDYKDAWKILWKSISGEQRKEVKSLPNFDKKVFKEITGITVK